LKPALLRLALLGALLAPSAPAQQDLKVLISVDMEGVTGVAVRDDASESGRDYQYFRRVMTEEANAAILGALDAGATDIIVRDSHGSKTNLLPEELHRAAVLVRGLDPGPKNMMFPIDETFDAAIFIGYHAKAGSANAVLAHTSNGNVIDFSINGVSLPEGGYNALIAGLYDVPVVFVSGDEAACNQIKALVGEIGSVAVKQAFGPTSVNMHPSRARVRIQVAVNEALRRRADFKPFKLKPPYKMTLLVKTEREQLHPGARRAGPGEFEFESDDLLAVLDAFNALK
jgi:D-amino peptidase